MDWEVDGRTKGRRCRRWPQDYGPEAAEASAYSAGIAAAALSTNDRGVNTTSDR